PSSASTLNGSSSWAATPPCSATATGRSRAAWPRWRDRPCSGPRAKWRARRGWSPPRCSSARRPTSCSLRGWRTWPGWRSAGLSSARSRVLRSRSPTLLREGAPGLHACAFFRPETVTWAFGAHACAVEVDVETGALRLLRYAAVHDCGRPLNPMVVEGQLHGGIVQGIGAALAEELIYDGDGQL